jgi:hypothetical protein
VRARRSAHSTIFGREAEAGQAARDVAPGMVADDQKRAGGPEQLPDKGKDNPAQAKGGRAARPGRGAFYSR